MKKLIAAVVACLSLGAIASSIHTWSSGDVLDASDLNANFAHIHNLMVGGHGARLVNADVSSSAAIAHTKLATPQLLPIMWAAIGGSAADTNTACGGSPCTVTITKGLTLTSATRTGAGHYVVNLTAARPNKIYAVVVSNTVSGGVNCMTDLYTTTKFDVYCYARAAGVDTLTDTAFMVTLYDDDN